jgi:Na+/melibiose symporter-like transporter
MQSAEKTDSNASNSEDGVSDSGSEAIRDFAPVGVASEPTAAVTDSASAVTDSASAVTDSASAVTDSASPAPDAVVAPVAFFVAAYVVQGVSQHFGILSQPLQYFLMKHEGLTAASVAGCMSLLMVPWIIKPLWAILTDFMPVAGYRRRSYLLLASAVAGLAMLAVPLLDSVPFASNVGVLIGVIVIGSVGMAFSNVVLNAMTIEACMRNPALRTLWSTQSLSYYSANIGCVALGGYLCSRFGEGDAINYAAVVAGLMPLLLLYVVLYAVREKKAPRRPFDAVQVKDAFLSCFKSPGYLAVCAYMCFFNLSPICSVPLYFYESNILKFDQGTIGQLNACTSFGMLCGGLIFKIVFEKFFSIKNQMVVTALISSAATLGYLLLSGNVLGASVIHFCWGIASTVSILALYGIASTVCPSRIEATAFSILIATYNGFGQLGQLAGSSLYTHVFANQIAPIMCLSATVSLVCALAVPFIAGRQAEVVK